MSVDTTRTKFTLRHNILKRYYADSVPVALTGAGTYTLYTHGLGWVPNVVVEYTTDAGRKQLISNMQFFNFSDLTGVGDIRGEIQVDTSTVKLKQISTITRTVVFHIKVYIDE